MDIVTQALLGASTAGVVATPRERRMALVVGAIAGMLPDADTLIRSDRDPLLFLEYHRHFTHSLVFIPVGGLVAALLLWWFFRHSLTFGRLTLYAVAGIGCAGLLDACTSYGTHLFWPFTPEPVAWHLLAIVDPVITLSLVVGIVLAARGRTATPLVLALTVSVAYLGFAWAQQQRARQALASVVETRGHQPTAVIVKPTLGNVLVWRGVYRWEGRLYADAIRAGWGDGICVVPGASAPLVSVGPLEPREWARFAARLSRFAGGYVVAHPNLPGAIGDARFAMLPGSVRPLWGVRPDPKTGASYFTDRRLSAEGRERFLGLISGCIGTPVSKRSE